MATLDLYKEGPNLYQSAYGGGVVLCCTGRTSDLQILVRGYIMWLLNPGGPSSILGFHVVCKSGGIYTPVTAPTALCQVLCPSDFVNHNQPYWIRSDFSPFFWLYTHKIGEFSLVEQPVPSYQLTSMSFFVSYSGSSTSEASRFYSLFHGWLSTI